MEERTGTIQNYDAGNRRGTLIDTDLGNHRDFINPANVPDVAAGKIVKYAVINTPAMVVNILKEIIN